MNMVMLTPFITIIRKPNVQEGTNNSGQWNIPGFPTFNYIAINLAINSFVLMQ